MICGRTTVGQRDAEDEVAEQIMRIADNALAFARQRVELHRTGCHRCRRGVVWYCDQGMEADRYYGDVIREHAVFRWLLGYTAQVPQAVQADPDWPQRLVPDDWEITCAGPEMMPIGGDR